MSFLINILKRISFKSPQKSKTIVFDKNYNRLLNKLIDSDFIVFNINSSELNIFLLINSALKYLFFKPKNVFFYEIYFKTYLEKINPEVVISFEDTDFRLIRLANFFIGIKFILVQNSYRPPGFYGKKTLKQDDLLITYSPLVEFNMSSNEIPMKTFKYFEGKDLGNSLKNKVILISQYRQYTNDELIEVEKKYYAEIDDGLLFRDQPNFYTSNQHLFLNFLSDFFNENENKFFYKSAFREQTSFIKDNETSYFKKFNISEFEVSSEDIFTTKSNDIYICFDSTMIFELISNNKKVLIYPHRSMFRNATFNPHIEIFAKKFPELVINENFSDFKNKFDLLDKISQEDYNSKYIALNSMQEFNLNKHI